MKSEEKSTNKEKQTLIIRKYHQYLKLEKALSPNTVDAYQTDLQKLLHFLEGEGIAILDTTLDDLQHFASGLHDIGIHLVGHQVILPFPRHGRLPGGRPQRTVGGTQNRIQASRSTDSGRDRPHHLRH